MIDLTTCKFVVWGYKNHYATHSHIHEGFYRGLKTMGKSVEWLDQKSNISKHDFSNTFFIANWDCLPPIRSDCFYTIHGLKDHAEENELFANHKGTLCWNVFNTNSRAEWYAQHGWTYTKIQNAIELAEDTPFGLEQKYMEMRWATDLSPDEIHANKPSELLHLKNRIIHWIGTVWWVNEQELSDFRRACTEDGIEFSHRGAGQKGVITVEDNIRLIRESWMAPAISGSHHLTEGYAPCRIFKNISYGQYGITNNPHVQAIFKDRLIYNPNAYKLYWEAKERLASATLTELHSLMDYVAEHHTYHNRINSMLKAAKLILEN